ncbi:MAG: WYL domain-containing protein [Leptospiraceae bacterium]|nr:WYL domain-containing protein [Leptospiraceae bacterium]
MNGPEPEKMPKAERLGCLYLTFLKRSRGLSFEEIRTLMPLAYVGEFESARRKFERDKEDLKKLGIPLRYYAPGTALPSGDLARAHIYVPEEGLEQLGQVQLTSGEREALAALLLQALQKDPDPDSRDAITSIYIKLFYDNLPGDLPANAATADAHTRDRRSDSLSSASKSSTIDSALDSPEPQPGASYADQSTQAGAASRKTGKREDDLISLQAERLALVQEALRRSLVLEGKYEPARGGIEKRTLESRGLIFYRGRWCLVARARQTKDIRFYYLERFRSLDLGTASFSADRGFDLRSVTLHPMGIHVHESRTIEIEIANDYLSMFVNFLSGFPSDRWTRNGSSFIFQTTNERALFRWILQRPEALYRLDPTASKGMSEFLEEIQELY